MLEISRVSRRVKLVKNQFFLQHTILSPHCPNEEEEGSSHGAAWFNAMRYIGPVNRSNYNSELIDLGLFLQALSAQLTGSLQFILIGRFLTAKIYLRSSLRDKIISWFPNSVESLLIDRKRAIYIIRQRDDDIHRLMGNGMSLTRRQKKCLCRPSPASCIHAPCGMEIIRKIYFTKIFYIEFRYNETKNATTH